MLQQKNNGPCQKKEPCPQRLKNGEQKGHQIKKIKEPKAKGAKVKGEKEKGLLKAKGNGRDQEEPSEQMRKVFIKAIDEQFKEVKKIPVEKQPEFVHQVQKKLLSVEKSLKGMLSDCNKAIKDFSLINQEVVKEISSVPKGQRQLSQAELTKRQKELRTMKFKSCFVISKTSECLEISLEKDSLKEIEVDLNEFKGIQKIRIKIGFLTQFAIALEPKESNSSLLGFLLRGLESFHTLEVCFNDRSDFDGQSFLWLGGIFGNYLRGLRKINLRFEVSSLGEKSIKVLCDNVLSKALNLQSFWINLHSAGISDGDIKTLVSSIRPFHKKLEEFSTILSGNNITDSGINEVLRIMQNMGALQTLELVLPIEATDRSLEFFGERVLPNLKALKSLSLKTNSFKISQKGILSILKNLPNLKKLVLDVSHISVSYKIMVKFHHEVLPKLNSLESFTLINLAYKLKDVDFQKMKIQKLGTGSQKQTVLTGGDLIDAPDSSDLICL